MEITSNRAHLLLCNIFLMISVVFPYVKDIEYWCYSKKSCVRYENKTRSLPQLASLLSTSHLNIPVTFKCRSQGDTDCERARSLLSLGSRQKIMTADAQSNEKSLWYYSLGPLFRFYARDTSLKSTDSDARFMTVYWVEISERNSSVISQHSQLFVAC